MARWKSSREDSELRKNHGVMKSSVVSMSLWPCWRWSKIRQNFRPRTWQKDHPGVQQLLLDSGNPFGDRHCRVVTLEISEIGVEKDFFHRWFLMEQKHPENRDCWWASGDQPGPRPVFVCCHHYPSGKVVKNMIPVTPYSESFDMASFRRFCEKEQHFQSMVDRWFSLMVS